MNGFSLLMAFASLGVVYSWRTGADQQQEYVLQIEPEIVQALLAAPRPGEQPEEIFSDVPANVGPLARLCITVLAKDGTPPRHTAAGEEQFRQFLAAAGRYASLDRALVPDAPATILWPGRSGANPEQTYGVTTGWQPDKAGNQQYIVQIDPTVLSALALGDELYVPVDPAAGRIRGFVVKAGREQLPRVGGVSALAQTPMSPLPGAGGSGRYPGASDGGAPSWSNNPSRSDGRQSPRFNNGLTDLPAADPRGAQYTTPVGSLPPQTYGSSAATAPTGYPNYNPAPTIPGNNFDQYRGPLAPPAETFSPPGYPVQPVASQQPPQLPPAQRPYNPSYPEARTAALPPAPIGTNPNVLQPQQDKPWGPLLFVTFALFFSIGGNLYLAYTALEFHSRYRNAIERLRSAARSA